MRFAVIGESIRGRERFPSEVHQDNRNVPDSSIKKPGYHPAWAFWAAEKIGVYRSITWPQYSICSNSQRIVPRKSGETPLPKQHDNHTLPKMLLSQYTGCCSWLQLLRISMPSSPCKKVSCIRRNSTHLTRFRKLYAVHLYLRRFFPLFSASTILLFLMHYP